MRKIYEEGHRADRPKWNNKKPKIKRLVLLIDRTQLIRHFRTPEKIKKIAKRTHWNLMIKTTKIKMRPNNIRNNYKPRSYLNLLVYVACADVWFSLFYYYSGNEWCTLFHYFVLLKLTMCDTLYIQYYLKLLVAIYQAALWYLLRKIPQFLCKEVFGCCF